MSERSEMDQWMIKLDPNMKAVFDATYDALETQKKILPGSKDAFDAAEQDLVQQAKDLAQGKPATHKAAQPEAEKSKLGVQGNYERPLEFPLKKYSLKWAEIKLKATCTLSVQNANASETAVTGGVSTGAQQTAVNMGVSVSLGDFDLLDKIDVSGVSVSFKNEFGSSKCKISFGVEGSISLRQVTVTQSSKVTGDVTLLEYEYGSGDVKAFELSVKVSRLAFQTEIKGVKVSGNCSFEASLAPNTEKVMAEAGKEIALKAGEALAKEEMEKTGAKVLTKELAGEVFSKLNALTTAFQIGWTAGDLLNRFTHSEETAEKGFEIGLGNLNEQVAEASTAGKVYLLAKNAPAIVATGLVAGAAGAAEGIGEIASKGYHAVMDGPSIYDEARNLIELRKQEEAITRQMEEDLDKTDVEEVETRYQSVAQDDPPPPPRR